MQENNSTPKRRTLVRLLALIAAAIVLAGSIFCIVGSGGQKNENGAAWAAPWLQSAFAEEKGFQPLRKGGSGAQVKEMQQALQALGYYSGAQDGNFSKALEAAVLTFQKDFDLKETGQIDYELYQLLRSEVPPAGASTPAPSAASQDAPFVVRGEWYSDQEHVAAYLRQFGELPENYITKKEAQALGWVSSEGNLWQVAPGKSIGGDRFGNYEGLLPKKKGRSYYECDIDFDGSYRNGKRIIFSNDGLIFYTDDHYESFKEIKE